MNSATASPPLAKEPFGARRTLLLVFGSIAALVALGLLTLSAAAAWGLAQRDDAGYFTSGAHELSTDSYALASESLDIGPDLPGWLDGDFASVRVETTSAEPLFLGLARTSDVRRYLADVRHAEITNFETEPFSVDYRDRAGDAQPAPPAEQTFWRAQASGAGTQTITWPVEEGSWSVVAMNADGAANVAADVRLGARVESLRGFAIGLLAAGGLLLLAGGGLIYLGARKPRSV